jgi:hypothetical protein
MKKFFGILTIVGVLSFSTSAFAAESGVSDCAKMSKGACVAMCAQKMEQGVSKCATATTPCEMASM